MTLVAAGVVLFLATVGLTVRSQNKAPARTQAPSAGVAHATRGPTQPTATAQNTSAILCPPEMIQDGYMCFPIAQPEQPEGDGIEMAALTNAHRIGDRSILTRYEHIPRAAERPESYEAYVYPVRPGLNGGRTIGAGYDLDKPDELQRRISKDLVGHGGLDMPGLRGTPVHLVDLEYQQGDADVVFAGTLFGNTVIMRHARSEPSGLRDYFVLYCHLDRIAPQVLRGARLKGGADIGGIGDSGGPKGVTHLHFEVRRLKDGIDSRTLAEGRPMITASVPCDPRNVLPLRKPK
jgi:murein DD-endopeptidase MepM/ murein hydrolase activator NlpD